AEWTRLRDDAPAALVITLTAAPQTARLILEVDDGDNPPLPLSDFRCDYRPPRLLFKASPGADLYLYYGRPDAAMPRYDLRLVADEILAAQPVEAALSAQEILKAKAWWEVSLPSGATKYLFWGVMGVVVLALLGVLAKLLPSEK